MNLGLYEQCSNIYFFIYDEDRKLILFNQVIPEILEVMCQLLIMLSLIKLFICILVQRS